MPWKLGDLKDPEPNAPTVLSTFSCGGGSSMGYKLAGFRLAGCVEIDPKMLAIYDRNLKPRHKFLMPIQEFNKIDREDLPDDLKNLDVLDGSPPCSVFSMAGSREDKWGSMHKFREGQATQILDDLFFHFVETARILRPKVVVAENVKGLIAGNARGYVKEIFSAFEAIGYSTQLFLLNSSRMGVPQRRERVFFLARRSDAGLPDIELKFQGLEIPVSSAAEGLDETFGKKLPPSIAEWWPKVARGKTIAAIHPKKHLFSWQKIDPRLPAPTITATYCQMHWEKPHFIGDELVARLQSFPVDYDFMDQKTSYVCGMSVPPYMMRAIANEIRSQWLD